MNKTSHVRFLIYRLKEQQPDNVRRRFEGTGTLLKLGDWPIKREHYAMFFTSTEPFPVSYCTEQVLEDIFRRYNGGNLPAHFCPEYFAEGYAEHWPSGAAYGLSVGDIVVLTDTYPREDLQEGAWFVDSVGFWHLGAKTSAQFEV